MRLVASGRACLSAAGSRAHWRKLRVASAHTSSKPNIQLDNSTDPSDTLLRRTEFSQDRIGRDGNLISGRLPAAPVLGPEDIQRPAFLPSTAPLLPPIADHQLQQLVDFVTGNRRLLVLTGAGCSTESAVPDYRGPQGAYNTGFKPMTHQQFMASEAARRRYWARSFAGWHEFSGVQPNAAHEALARLQGRGWLSHLITQNVDRLHHKAGSTDVIELHGTTHRVVCMQCEDLTERQPFQEQLAALNPEAAAAVAKMARAGPDAEAARQRALCVGAGERDDRGGAFVRRPDGDVEIPVRRPDGDVELRDAGTNFVVPPCPRCGGILKPYVVFFGDGVPPDRSSRALELAEGCDGLLVVGSSLMVYSAFRLAKAAKASGGALAVLTAGPTRADAVADLKIEALAGEALSRMAAHPSLLIPRL
ncbi:NAD-dependent protein deacetylase [Coccomyxa sp. Obi]|nr:NAD-dependent protein deacetylase [Coccomyxa sp. Obi]